MRWRYWSAATPAAVEDRVLSICTGRRCLLPVALDRLTTDMRFVTALRRRQSLTMAIHAFCHTIWWAIIGFFVVLAVTEATKPWASRYRPDYMSRCKPNLSEGKPLGFFQRTDCAPDVKGSDFVKDGRCACVMHLCLVQEKHCFGKVQVRAFACSCERPGVAYSGLCSWVGQLSYVCPALVLRPAAVLWCCRKSFPSGHSSNSMSLCW